MIWIRRAWPLALLALPLLTACPEDDGETTTVANTSNETAATSNETAGTADETANSSEGDPALGCAAGAIGETTDGATDPIMQTWGAPCQTDADCVELIGDPDAICDTSAVVYELPGGYCTKDCTLPDPDTRAVPDAADCDPAGGVACIGVQNVFQRCGILCTDDLQCNRDGYICRALPMIGTPADPKMCLMPDCCLDTCEES